MQTHRFILVDDLTTGRQTVIEYTASDAERIYTAHERASLDLGKTVVRGDMRHTDMQAFVNTHRGMQRLGMIQRALAAVS